MASSGVRLCQIHELLDAIFDYVQPSTLPLSGGKFEAEDECTRKELRSSLLSAAQASRTLSEHALDVLWRGLDDLAPLVSLLFPLRPFFVNKDAALLHSSLIDEQWQRFKTYAQRVRTLRADYGGCFNPLIWAFILCRCRTEPLLPNLRVISVLPINMSSLTTLVMVPTTLRCLYFGTDSAVDDNEYKPISGFLRDIGKRAPGLEALTLHRNPDFEPIRPESLFALKCFQCLNSIDLENSVFDLEMLRWAAGLKTLHTLRVAIEIRVKDDSDYSRDGKLFLPGAFRKLRHLSLHGTRSDILKFTSNIRLPPFLSLSLDASEQNSPQYLATLVSACVGAFTRNPGVQQLEEFALADTHARWRDEDSLLKIAAPLLSCRTLKKVSFLFTGFPSIKDEDLTRMARSWPELTSFRASRNMTPWFLYTQGDLPTIASLGAFAEYCPKLAELSLADIDLRDNPPVCNMRFDNHPLRSLQAAFRTSRNASEHSHYAAEVIDRLFPSVTVHLPPNQPTSFFDRPIEDDDDFEELFGVVKRHVEALQRVRRQREVS
ncbi:hypothetical protein L226DRAFT_160138 [Lentinus tigrinus ALCF2SS1-7]|uniref:F-box domain-containing protein n=1 Tax=Lentinus tigrinus ALCF2SS1-6 TaxID=1328759 RepID=A0A5C2S1M0_9APHY|nr:hypothetical protein L227DRAFT_602473 [Lentinus tigrinus ALCF2SS1-6]RPD72001.1 hypothetical protein L226DRAFT_160138 [Lentinus tigrinus ALCF2SS1-7]